MLWPIIIHDLSLPSMLNLRGEKYVVQYERTCMNGWSRDTLIEVSKYTTPFSLACSIMWWVEHGVVSLDFWRQIVAHRIARQLFLVYIKETRPKLLMRSRENNNDIILQNPILLPFKTNPTIIHNTLHTHFAWDQEIYLWKLLLTTYYRTYTVLTSSLIPWSAAYIVV